jgi:hypothetical protein
MDQLNNFSSVSLMEAYWSLRVATIGIEGANVELMSEMSFLF